MAKPHTHRIHLAAGHFSINEMMDGVIRLTIESMGFKWRFDLTLRDCGYLAKALLDRLPDNFEKGMKIKIAAIGDEYGLDRSGWAYWVGTDNHDKLLFRIDGQGNDARVTLTPDEIYHLGQLLDQFSDEEAA